MVSLTHLLSVPRPATAKTSGMSSQTIDVLIVYAPPPDVGAGVGSLVWQQQLTLPKASSVAQAIASSDLLRQFPALDWQVSGVGIFGKQVQPSRLLCDGERIEIYRALIFDPKESRRRRALHKRRELKTTDNRSSSMDDSVLFEMVPCVDGTQLGIATLNRPQTLNGLSLQMTRLLDERLQAWVRDPSVGAVILKGAGEKAFCAGGDLHSLHHEMLAHHGQPATANHYACSFFAEEYALDYLIHTYPKPILVWGDGIVMGGGMGLMAGASHRVVTERSRLAMPEISIGLFPDVGGSWLLAKAPGRTGVFLGLTGAQLGASDAILAGMADIALPSDQFDTLLEALRQTKWHDEYSDFQRVTDILQKLALTDLPVGPMRTHFDLIQRICGGYELEVIAQNIATLANHEDPWLARAAKTFAAGCPASARLSWILWRCARQLSLADVFRMEWGVAIECAASGTFTEGIRAVLIDKDRNPKWQPATLEETAGEWCQPYFAIGLDDPEHPLADLGR
jgi:enoyl-CoA hydratase/carnithine racemase/putative ubiquitin-RnfH superfamily antitoxin RatB of RatAB toxin-antitoxin module